MTRTRVLCRPVLALALGLALCSGTCVVHYCSGDCGCDHDHCDHPDHCDCDHGETHAAETLPILLPRPGFLAPEPVWIPAPR